MKTQHTHLLAGTMARASIAQAIANARQSLDLLCYAISPAPYMDSTLKASVFYSLCQAPTRRVICRAVIARHHPGSPHEANNEQAAIELHRNGWEIYRYPCRPVMHCKLIIADRHRMITGSHNLTSAALEHNRELSVMTTDQDCLYDAQKFFETLLGASAPHGKDRGTNGLPRLPAGNEEPIQPHDQTHLMGRRNNCI